MCVVHPIANIFGSVLHPAVVLAAVLHVCCALCCGNGGSLLYCAMTLMLTFLHIMCWYIV